MHIHICLKMTHVGFTAKILKVLGKTTNITYLYVCVCVCVRARTRASDSVSACARGRGIVHVRACM